MYGQNEKQIIEVVVVNATKVCQQRDTQLLLATALFVDRRSTTKTDYRTTKIKNSKRSRIDWHTQIRVQNVSKYNDLNANYSINTILFSYSMFLRNNRRTSDTQRRKPFEKLLAGAKHRRKQCE